jgi:hypothetical protein
VCGFLIHGILTAHKWLTKLLTWFQTFLMDFWQKRLKHIEWHLHGMSAWIMYFIKKTKLGVWRGPSPKLSRLNFGFPIDFKISLSDTKHWIRLPSKCNLNCLAPILIRTLNWSDIRKPHQLTHSYKLMFTFVKQCGNFYKTTVIKRQI